MDYYDICPNCKGSYSQSFNMKCVWCGYKLPSKKVKKNKKKVKADGKCAWCGYVLPNCKIVKKNKKDKKKVVIIVDGGNIQNIYSNFKDIDVQVLDLDNCKDEGKSGDEIVEIYNDMTKGLEEVSW